MVLGQNLEPQTSFGLGFVALGPEPRTPAAEPRTLSRNPETQPQNMEPQPQNFEAQPQNLEAGNPEAQPQSLETQPQSLDPQPQDREPQSFFGSLPKPSSKAASNHCFQNHPQKLPQTIDLELLQGVAPGAFSAQDSRKSWQREALPTAEGGSRRRPARPSENR